MQTAAFAAERLRTLKPRLQQRLCEVEAAEANARWAREYERVKAAVENAACKFAEYPDLAARLIARVTIDVDGRDHRPRRVVSSWPARRGHTMAPRVVANVRS
jgi:hypothetical protein